MIAAVHVHWFSITFTASLSRVTVADSLSEIALYDPRSVLRAFTAFKVLPFIFLFAITAAGVVLTTKKQVSLCRCELIRVSAFIVCKIMTNLGIPRTGLNQNKPRQRHIYYEHFQRILRSCLERSVD